MVSPELFDIYYKLKILRDELNTILDELDKFDFKKTKEKIKDEIPIIDAEKVYNKAYQEALKSLVDENLKDTILKELEQRKVIPLIELEKRYKDQKDKLNKIIEELKNERKIKIINGYVSLKIQTKQELSNKEILKLKKRLEELENKKARIEEKIQFMKKFGQDKINPQLVKEKEDELNKVLEEIVKIKQQLNM